MNATLTATPARTRLAALLGAVLTSAAVLGATVASMQPRYDGPVPHMVALEAVVVTAGAIN